MEIPEWRVEVLQVTAELEKLKEEHEEEWSEFIAKVREYGIIAEKLARLARKQRFWQLVREARRARDRLRRLRL